MPVFETSIPGLPEPYRGKVRDNYDLGDKLLIIATDRLSAFDVVFGDPIPGKGEVLTSLTLFWLELLKDIVPNHLITAETNEMLTALEDVGVTSPERCSEILQGRAMLVKKARPFPIECVVRGYISGSLWSEYLKLGRPQELYGHPLPDNLQESQKLPNPIFTPATKAIEGHDENISPAQAGDMIGGGMVAELDRLSTAIYCKASDYAATKGIIIADTKFEFGIYNGEIILIDEVLTPDSSRFWDASSYAAGRAQDSFDKQYVRDYVQSIGWNKQPPAPTLPAEVIKGTTEKYQTALRRLFET